VDLLWSFRGLAVGALDQQRGEAHAPAWTAAGRGVAQCNRELRAIGVAVIVRVRQAHRSGRFDRWITVVD
jgi:hypothetical protein